MTLILAAQTVLRLVALGWAIQMLVRRRKPRGVVIALTVYLSVSVGMALARHFEPSFWPLLVDWRFPGWVNTLGLLGAVLLLDHALRRGQQTEERLLEVNARLDGQVRGRTGRLLQSNDLLRQEIDHRRKAEQALRAHVRELENSRAVMERQAEQLRHQAGDLEKARQAALESSRLKSEFLANMSHEIRTPMNGVIGITDLLGQTELDRKQAEYVEMIRTSSEALLEIINDILDLSKIEAGALRVEKSPFPLRETVGHAAALVQAKAREKRLDLRIRIDPQVPEILVADCGRFRQVLLNLLGNALKFTPEGGSIELRAAAYEEPAGARWLRFEVEDSGIGMAREVQARLFSAFYQADGSPARRYGGAGLGLAISRQLVERMGGRIGVESEPGNGSTFWFTLPLVTADAPPAPLNSNAALPAAPPGSPGAPRRPVLLAEDNPVNRVVALKMLEKLGWPARAVANGREAVDAAHSGEYGVILMDCQMPEMDGYQAARRIRQRERDEDLPRLPIIALTANAMKGDRELCLDAGMDDYLSKPVQLGALAEALERWQTSRPA